MLLAVVTDSSATQSQTTQNLAPKDSTDGLMHLLHIISEFYSNGIDEHLTVAALLFVIILDIILGTLCAWVYREYEPYKFRRGLVSHVTMFTLTAVLYPLFMFAGLSSGADSFILAMIFAYTSSIIANLARLGIHIPFLDSYIRNNIDSHKFELKSSDTPEDVQRKLGYPKKQLEKQEAKEKRKQKKDKKEKSK